MLRRIQLWARQKKFKVNFFATFHPPVFLLNPDFYLSQKNNAHYISQYICLFYFIMLEKWVNSFQDIAPMGQPLYNIDSSVVGTFIADASCCGSIPQDGWDNFVEWT